jgi:nucleotide-binding universal stress UspA family protein
VTVERALGVGGAAEEIVAYAERNGIDLIALASHGRSGVQRWVHGSVADRVLHATRTPLLVARPDDGCEVRRVVVCLDGSLAAEGALPVAGALASRLGMPLVRVRVVEAMRLGVLDDPGGSLRRSLVAQEREAALRYLEAVPGGAGVPGEADVLVGRPADEIDAYVQKHPGSLLVLTTRAHRGLPLLVLGSVAHRVVPHAVTGVVLLHAPEQSAG